MRDLQLSYSFFPSPSMNVAETALITLVNDDRQEMWIIYSRNQAVALSGKIAAQHQRLMLLQVAGKSTLPEQSDRDPVRLSDLSAAYVAGSHIQFRQRGKAASVLNCRFPSLLILEIPSVKRFAELQHITNIPDFLGCAMNNEGLPEVVIGFSQNQAREYLDARRHWAKDKHDWKRRNRNIDESVLPETSGTPSVTITGAAASFICELIVMTGLESQKK